MWSAVVAVRDRRVLALAAALVITAVSGCAGTSIDDASGGTASPGYSGTVVDDPPVALPTASLLDTAGASVDLRAASTAPITLAVFAYTTCLDECPMTVSSVAAALRGLPAQERDAVQLLVLSADPARDTPSALRRWLDRFGAGFVGLTGEPETLARVARELYVPLELASPAATSDGDDVAHGVQIWAFGPDDRSRMVWTDIPTPGTLRRNLSRLVADEAAR